MDNSLNEAREEIRLVDKEIAQLFERRMNAAKKVAAFKKQCGIPILDEKQEALVLERNSAYIKNESLKPYYITFQQNVMAVSRQYQHRLNDGARIAYSGVEGAYAHIAAGKIFPNATLVSYPSFDDAYKACEDGECDCAVMPIENSFAGEVGHVNDLMLNGSLFVNSVYDLPIRHCLLGTQNAKLENIKTVTSHPQALSQCEGYIRRHSFEQVSASNTAIAAENVAKQNDPTIAAIASKETAELYGLKVIDHDINQSRSNTTRFVVLSPVPAKQNVSSDANTLLLLFSVNNTAGSLAKAIEVIGKFGFNMKALRSRPLKELAWQYYFYIEAEGNGNPDDEKAMLEALSEQCAMLKVLGRYSNEKTLD